MTGRIDFPTLKPFRQIIDADRLPPGERMVRQLAPQEHMMHQLQVETAAYESRGAKITTLLNGTALVGEIALACFSTFSVFFAPILFPQIGYLPWIGFGVSIGLGIALGAAKSVAVWRAQSYEGKKVLCGLLKRRSIHPRSVHDIDVSRSFRPRRALFRNAESHKASGVADIERVARKWDIELELPAVKTLAAEYLTQDNSTRLEWQYVKGRVRAAKAKLLKDHSERGLKAFERTMSGIEKTALHIHSPFYPAQFAVYQPDPDLQQWSFEWQKTHVYMLIEEKINPLFKNVPYQQCAFMKQHLKKLNWDAFYKEALEMKDQVQDRATLLYLHTRALQLRNGLNNQEWLRLVALCEAFLANHKEAAFYKELVEEGALDEFNALKEAPKTRNYKEALENLKAFREKKLLSRTNASGFRQHFAIFIRIFLPNRVPEEEWNFFSRKICQVQTEAFWTGCFQGSVFHLLVSSAICVAYFCFFSNPYMHIATGCVYLAVAFVGMLAQRRVAVLNRRELELKFERAFSKDPRIGEVLESREKLHDLRSISDRLGVDGTDRTAARVLVDPNYCGPRYKQMPKQMEFAAPELRLLIRDGAEIDVKQDVKDIDAQLDAIKMPATAGPIERDWFNALRVYAAQLDPSGYLLLLKLYKEGQRERAETKRIELDRARRKAYSDLKDNEFYAPAKLIKNSEWLFSYEQLVREKENIFVSELRALFATELPELRKLKA